MSKSIRAPIIILIILFVIRFIINLANNYIPFAYVWADPYIPLLYIEIAIYGTVIVFLLCKILIYGVKIQKNDNNQIKEKSKDTLSSYLDYSLITDEHIPSLNSRQSVSIFFMMIGQVKLI